MRGGGGGEGGRKEDRRRKESCRWPPATLGVLHQESNSGELDIPASIRRRQIEFAFRFTAAGVKARL